MLTRATTTNLSTRSLAGTPVRERAVARSTGRCVERTNERTNERPRPRPRPDRTSFIRARTHRIVSVSRGRAQVMARSHAFASDVLFRARDQLRVEQTIATADDATSREVGRPSRARARASAARARGRDAQKPRRARPCLLSLPFSRRSRSRCGARRASRCSTRTTARPGSRSRAAGTSRRSSRPAARTARRCTAASGSEA